MTKRLPDGVPAHGCFALLFAFQFFSDPVAFFFGQPSRLPRKVSKVEKRNFTKNDGRDALEYEQPAPSRFPTSMDLENSPRQRRSDDVGKRDRSHEYRDCFGAVFNPEPVGEVDDDAGEETSFRYSEKKARRVKLSRGVDETDNNRDDAPRDHDAGNPAARAPALD